MSKQGTSNNEVIKLLYNMPYLSGFIIINYKLSKL